MKSVDIESVVKPKAKKNSTKWMKEWIFAVKNLKKAVKNDEKKYEKIDGSPKLA